MAEGEAAGCAVAVVFVVEDDAGVVGLDSACGVEDWDAGAGCTDFSGVANPGPVEALRGEAALPSNDGESRFVLASSLRADINSDAACARVGTSCPVAGEGVCGVSCSAAARPRSEIALANPRA